MRGSTLLLAFVGIKVALVVLFWRAAVRGFELRDRIEARKQAEREALRAAEAVGFEAAPAPVPAEVSRPAA